MSDHTSLRVRLRHVLCRFYRVSYTKTTELLIKNRNPSIGLNFECFMEAKKNRSYQSESGENWIWLNRNRSVSHRCVRRRTSIATLVVGSHSSRLSDNSSRQPALPAWWGWLVARQPQCKLILPLREQRFHSFNYLVCHPFAFLENVKFTFS